MVGLEFYLFEDELWCKTTDGRNFVLDESKTDLIKYLLDSIRSRYPNAYKALENVYKKSALNVSFYQFLMVRRFCKCNFCKLDSTQLDVHEDGRFNIEKVECPMRGECAFEGVICMPKFNSSLTGRGASV